MTGVGREQESTLGEGAARLSFSPRDDGWRYTARPEWSSDGESMWMRLSKFSHCNRLSVAELADLFAAGKPDTGADAVDLRRADRWNLHALATILEISADDVRAGFCVMEPQRALGRAFTELRYCPACLANGFHAAWFQWQHIERCPLHDMPLRVGCVGCTEPVPYALGRHLASNPLSCSSCGCSWVPSISQPAGRCVPMSRRETRLLGRWAVYVDHVVSDDHHLCRDQHTGQFVAAITHAPQSAATRPHVLTMLNRLFDAPPPLPAQIVSAARFRAASPVDRPGATLPRARPSQAR